MRAGQLRQRVTIQEKIAEQDGFGEEIITYSDWATVWARVEPVDATELNDQQRAAANATHRVTIRYRRDLVPTMRLAWADGDVTRVMEINGIVPDAARREIVITAVEIPEEGTPFTIGVSAIGGSGRIGTRSDDTFTIGSSSVGGAATVE